MVKMFRPFKLPVVVFQRPTVLESHGTIIWLHFELRQFMDRVQNDGWITWTADMNTHEMIFAMVQNYSQKDRTVNYNDILVAFCFFVLLWCYYKTIPNPDLGWLNWATFMARCFSGCRRKEHSRHEQSHGVYLQIKKLTNDPGSYAWWLVSGLSSSAIASCQFESHLQLTHGQSYLDQQKIAYEY